MKQANICKLCEQKSILIGKSHIIPNFMYKGLFDENRKMLIADLKNLEKKPRVTQSGIFEKNILCPTCESLFSKFERYTSHFFKGTGNSSLKFERRRSHDGLRSIYVSGINYNSLKLCFLSILWRAHISENDFFKRINLSESNEKEIRQMLLEGNAKGDDEYRVSFLGLQNAANDFIRLLIDPSVETIGTGKVALFLINGYCYFIDLKPKSSFKIFDKVYLKHTGEIDVPLLNEQWAIKILTAFGIESHIANNYVRFRKKP